jgi:hypothetical protein
LLPQHAVGILHCYTAVVFGQLPNADIHDDGVPELQRLTQMRLAGKSCTDCSCLCYTACRTLHMPDVCVIAAAVGCSCKVQLRDT